jgi:hypothetical protein
MLYFCILGDLSVCHSVYSTFSQPASCKYYWPNMLYRDKNNWQWWLTHYWVWNLQYPDIQSLTECGNSTGGTPILRSGISLFSTEYHIYSYRYAVLSLSAYLHFAGTIWPPNFLYSKPCLSDSYRLESIVYVCTCIQAGLKISVGHGHCPTHS